MSDGHHVRTCTSELMCSSCKRNHPISLQDIYSEGQKSTDGGDQYPKNTEEALTNNFAG